MLIGYCNDVVGRFKQSRAVGRQNYALADLGEIDCEPVTTTDQWHYWQTLMDAEHELGSGPLVGSRLCYLIRSEHLGVVGALAFSAAAWQLAARDHFIGWDDTTRRAHLQQVVCNSRFLIRPHLCVPDLASHVLARCLRCLPDDWHSHYGWRPVLVETFIDRSRYRGGCYRAANWTYVGDTRGRGRNDTTHAAARTVKAIYVYPLGRRWRRQLGVAQAPEMAPATDDWACHEFAHALLWDQRLHQRVITVGRDFAAQSTAGLPQACGSRAKTKAAYRLFDHPQVTMQELLGSHYQATAARCRGQPTVLAVQDTTSLNYTTQSTTTGLGPVGTGQDQAQGLIVHDTLAFTPQGTPLGVLDGQCWARAQDTVSADRASRAFEDKESYKWQQSYTVADQLQQQCDGTRVVSVADREGDIYELLCQASQPAQPDILIRARHLHRLDVRGDKPQKLIKRLQACPMAGQRELPIPRRGNVGPRTATMAVRYMPVTFKPPKGKAHLPSVTLDVVHTTEIDPPAGVKPLTWTLLTTVATESFDAACERLSWYAIRWQIEVYHRTLKSGCRIKDRQLGDSGRLKNCLAIDMVVAWRVFLLTQLSREQPDQPCSALFEPDEWRALLIRTGTTQQPQAEDEPGLYKAVRLVAGLGGFLGRRGDGEPGTQTVWRGLQRLDETTTMYRIMRDSQAPPCQRTYG